MAKQKSDFSFEIKKHIGVISEGTKGWKKELNLVKWGDNSVQLDIRSWDENHEKMSKGICLTREEAVELSKLLAKIK